MRQRPCRSCWNRTATSSTCDRRLVLIWLRKICFKGERLNQEISFHTSAYGASRVHDILYFRWQQKGRLQYEGQREWSRFYRCGAEDPQCPSFLFFMAVGFCDMTWYGATKTVTAKNGSVQSTLTMGGEEKPYYQRWQHLDSAYRRGFLYRRWLHLHCLRPSGYRSDLWCKVDSGGQHLSICKSNPVDFTGDVGPI